MSNEKKIRNIIITAFALFVIFATTTFISTVRQTNFETRAIRAELETERSKVEYCRNELKSANESIRNYETELSKCVKTIDDSRNELRNITEGLSNDSAELQDIVANLKRLSNGIKNLEDILYSWDTNSNCNNSIYNEEDRGEINK